MHEANNFELDSTETSKNFAKTVLTTVEPFSSSSSS